MTTPNHVLDFWFSPQSKPYWFAKSDAFDAQIAALFSDAYETARTGGYDAWCETAGGYAALVILLDQFSRNLFRGSPRAFESDQKALALTRHAIANRIDQALTPEQRHFLYLPLMHSENLDDQEQSVAMFRALGIPEGIDYAEQHRDVIARFGRFPHRNAVLGRHATDAETEFLATHAGF